MLVEGAASDKFEIANSVFQDTVLGSPLWNIFFADIILAACTIGSDPSTFADDLGVFQQFDREMPEEDAFSTLRECRESVHKWGRVNRVAFDADKEHLILIHPIYAAGDPFKLLGCMTDCKLTMDVEIERMLAKARPKITTLPKN